jgi:hypothetical protein
MRGALQETWEIVRKSPGNHLNSAATLAFLGLWCSGEAQEKVKYHRFVFLVVF